MSTQDTNTPPADGKATALVAQIDREAAQTIAGIEAAAAADTAETVARAHRRARETMRAALADLRRTRDGALQRERARLDTARRQALQSENLDNIVAGLPLVRDALTALWSTAKTRRAWADALAAEAANRLAHDQWDVDHPADWGQKDADALARTIQRLTGSPPRFTADPNLTAGLRIRAGTACVDGTLDRLMADGTEIGAGLLAALDDLKKEKTDD